MLEKIITGPRLAEGPLYDGKTGILWFVDIDGRAFGMHDTKTGETELIPTEAHCTACCLTTDEDKILVAVGSSLLLFDTGSKTFSHHLTIPLPEGMRFNDGAAAPDGSFVIGSMMANGPRDKVGKLFRVEKGSWTELEGFDFTVPNGIAFLPDGSFFHIDSPEDVIRKFRIDGGKLVCEGEYHFPEGASPDGMALDSGGRPHVALWNGKRVDTLDWETKSIVESVETAKDRTSSCGFGQDGVLYITAGRSADGEGCVFRTSTASKRGPVFRYAL